MSRTKRFKSSSVTVASCRLESENAMTHLTNCEYESPGYGETEHERACRYQYSDALAPERKPPASKWSAVIVLAILCGVALKALNAAEWIADEWNAIRASIRREWQEKKR